MCYSNIPCVYATLIQSIGSSWDMYGFLKSCHNSTGKASSPTKKKSHLTLDSQAYVHLANT